MQRNDVISVSFNFTFPPEIIREYFDGLAKISSASSFTGSSGNFWDALGSAIAPVVNGKTEKPKSQKEDSAKEPKSQKEDSTKETKSQKEDSANETNPEADASEQKETSQRPSKLFLRPYYDESSNGNFSAAMGEGNENMMKMATTLMQGLMSGMNQASTQKPTPKDGETASEDQVPYME